MYSNSAYQHSIIIIIGNNLYKYILKYYFFEFSLKINPFLFGVWKHKR